jgi:two-component system, OmpR family, osmolarity sensor histidine kinase EnvZ
MLGWSDIRPFFDCRLASSRNSSSPSLALRRLAAAESFGKGRYVPLFKVEGLINLVDNARRYGSHVRPPATAGDDGLDILLDDNGLGIAPADRDRVLYASIPRVTRRPAGLG